MLADRMLEKDPLEVGDDYRVKSTIKMSIVDKM